MSARNQGFPKSARITKGSIFREVYASGKKIHLGPILVIWRFQGEQSARLGITISKRVSGAVGRNRFKRLIREAHRKLPPLPAGVDLVVIARQRAHALDATTLSNLLEKAHHKIRHEPAMKPQ